MATPFLKTTVSYSLEKNENNENSASDQGDFKFITRFSTYACKHRVGFGRRVCLARTLLTTNNAGVDGVGELAAPYAVLYV